MLLSLRLLPLLLLLLLPSSTNRLSPAGGLASSLMGNKKAQKAMLSGARAAV